MADTKVDKVVTTPSYESPREEGDFHLLECSIHSPSGGSNAVQLNTAGRLVELNIYEDLFSNVLKGTLTMLDTQGLAETIPLIGDETLILSLGLFRVFRVCANIYKSPQGLIFRSP